MLPAARLGSDFPFLSCEQRVTASECWACGEPFEPSVVKTTPKLSAVGFACSISTARNT